MSSLISIIVPIYKVEAYLDRCINSLVNQTYEKIEIILVDDGSPDNCPQLCDDWAEKDSRIKVVHKKNGGLSDARNAGLKIATGELIAFVDSDDWVHPQMYEKLYAAMQMYDNDIVSCEFVKRTELNEQDFCICNKEIKSTLFNTEDALRELILDKELKQVVWNKLYKKETLQDIQFEYGKYNEDEFWSYQVIAKASLVAVIDFVGYFYFQRSDSIIGESYSLKRLDGLEGKSNRQCFIDEHYPTLSGIARLNLFYSYCYAYQCCLRSLSKKEISIAKKRIKNGLNSCRLKWADWRRETLKQKLWIVMYHVSLEQTCRLRNRLKIGL